MAWGSPFRERPYELQMIALAGSGRQAEALQTYQQVYRRFVEDLGIEPGPAIRELEQRILRGETVSPHRTQSRPAPRELPAAAPMLTGRDKVIDAVSDALRAAAGTAPAVAVLVGPGGFGKTALAVGCAHRLAGEFPDGQLYAELRGSGPAPSDPYTVLGRFPRAPGVDGGSLSEDPDERISLYRSTLAGTRTLVVLDDATNEEQVRPLLPGVAGCATMVTSRRQLAALVGATRWTVPCSPRMTPRSCSLASPAASAWLPSRTRRAESLPRAGFCRWPRASRGPDRRPSGLDAGGAAPQAGRGAWPAGRAGRRRSRCAGQHRAAAQSHWPSPGTNAR